MRARCCKNSKGPRIALAARDAVQTAPARRQHGASIEQQRFISTVGIACDTAVTLTSCLQQAEVA